jgi:translocator protein
MRSIRNSEMAVLIDIRVSMSKPKQIAGLVVSLVIVLGVASLGKLFSDLSVSTWYPTLMKPSWTPSGGTIGMVWTILYTLMGIAAWIVWRRGGVGDLQLPLAIYAIQLLLNAGWSALFFGLRSPGLALFEIGVLWIAILATAKAFWKVSKPAGALMVPYLIWVGLAAVLNVMIWRLN